MSKASKLNRVRLFDVILIIILGILCLLTVYPVLYVFSSSISDPGRLNMHTGLVVLPIGLSSEGYKAILKNPSIWIGYRNTIFYVVAGTAINLILTSLGAYALSRPKLYLGKVLTFIVVLTMQFGGGLVPTYIVVNKILGNSIFTLLLPQAIITTNLIIMRTSFAALPESLLESARIDGAGDMTIFVKVILPLSKPVIAVMALYYGVNHWNEWFQASIYIKDRKLFPLQLFLREMILQNQIDQASMGVDASQMLDLSEVIKYSTIMVSIIPVLIIYPFLQKYFVKGVMIGAIKG